MCVQACMGVCSGPWPPEPVPPLLYATDTPLTSELGPAFLPSLTSFHPIHTAPPHPHMQTWTCVHTHAHMPRPMHVHTQTAATPATTSHGPAGCPPRCLQPCPEDPAYTVPPAQSRSALTLKCWSQGPHCSLPANLLLTPNQRDSLSAPPHPRGQRTELRAQHPNRCQASLRSTGQEPVTQVTRLPAWVAPPALRGGSG